MTDAQSEIARGLLSDDLDAMKANIRDQQAELRAAAERHREAHIQAAEKAVLRSIHTTQDDVNPLDMQIGGDHYKGFVIQPVEFCQRNGLRMCESNAIKYLCRHRLKGGREDLRKARHFIDLLEELEYGGACKGRDTDGPGHPRLRDDRDRPWVYVAGPYTSDPTGNTRKARLLANEVWRLGYWPLVPHNTHEWHEATPKLYEDWMAYGRAMLRLCDCLLRDGKRLPGASPGADQEERDAVAWGIPIAHSLAELQERFPCPS